MRRSDGNLAAVGLVLVLGGACAGDDCKREGCDALNERADDAGRSGVAGVVAYESDVVANGCDECGFSSTHVDFWATTGEVSTAADAVAVVDAAAPTTSIDATAHYSLALEAGSYLACADSECASITVRTNHVTTLHILLVFGPPQFFVYDVGATKPRKTAAFEIGLR